MLNKEELKLLKNCKTEEELKEVIKKYNLKLTEEELSKVAGGIGTNGAVIPVTLNEEGNQLENDGISPYGF